MLSPNHTAQWKVRESTARPSDRELTLGISQGNIVAMGHVYDRYVGLVWTLAADRPVRVAEAVVESVFVDLWTRGQSRGLPLPLVQHVIDLARAHLLATSDTFVPDVQDTPALVGWAVLERFERFPPFVRSVLLLVCLAKLKVHEIADALEVEPAVVKGALSIGLRLVPGVLQTEASVAEVDERGEMHEAVPHQAQPG
jgi:hypothetical protein